MLKIIHQHQPNIRPFTYLCLALCLLGLIPPSFAEIPASIAQLPLNEWRSISNNTIADEDPCPNRECAWSGSEGQLGVTDAWTGGIFASKLGKYGALVYAGGGHNAYYGNEVYAFDLEKLLWKRLNDPTDGKTPGDASTFGLNQECRFWDGAPVMPHTYDSVGYDPVANRLILLTPHDAASHVLPGRENGCDSTTPAYFDFSTNTWGSMKSAGPAGLTDGPTAYDSKRKLFWGRTGYRAPRLFVAFDPAKDKWQQYEDEPINVDAMGAIDPVRDLFVSAEFRYGPHIGVLDLSSPSKLVTYIKTEGDKAIEEKSGLGFEWANKLGGFIAWNNGMDVYLLTPPKKNWRKETWKWSRIATTGEDPGRTSNGAFSKFQWVDELGIAVIAPGIRRPVFAIRLAD